jgi:hypothetical protein
MKGDEIQNGEERKKKKRERERKKKEKETFPCYLSN